MYTRDESNGFSALVVLLQQIIKVLIYKNVGLSLWMTQDLSRGSRTNYLTWSKRVEGIR